MKKQSMKKIEFRLRRIAQIWSIIIIVFTLIMLIGYAINWVKTGTSLECSGFGPCLALGGIGRSNKYWLLPGQLSGALLDDFSPTLSLSDSNSTPHPRDIIPGMLVDIKKKLINRDTSTPDNSFCTSAKYKVFVSTEFSPSSKIVT